MDRPTRKSNLEEFIDLVTLIIFCALVIFAITSGIEAIVGVR